MVSEYKEQGFMATVLMPSWEEMKSLRHKLTELYDGSPPALWLGDYLKMSFCALGACNCNLELLWYFKQKKDNHFIENKENKLENKTSNNSPAN